MALIDKLTAIGNKIRERLGGTELIPISNMPNEIDVIYKRGKQAEYDEFWDSFQENGNRTVYRNSFGCGWSAENFNPKYSMRPTNANQMFFNNVGEIISIPDFVEFCNHRGIELDFSNCMSAQYGIGTLHSRHFGVLNFSNCTNMQDIFYSHSWGNNAVITIDEFICSEITTFRADTFQSATQLTNLTMSGVVAAGTFDVSACTLLTYDSLMSIISCLKDLSGDGTTKTCTLGATNLAKLTDSEKAIATQKGWTLA